MMHRIIFSGLLLSSSVGTILTAADPVEEGQALYNAMCFACHGHKLEGGSGFNLKDAEWVHGGSPDEIFNSIKKGFPEKGMIPFGTVYSDEQLRAIVDFILSKQEGLRNVSYEIFHEVPADAKINDFDWSQLKPAKSGTLGKPFLNLTLPEVSSFGLAYKADLYVPAAGRYKIKGEVRALQHPLIKVNGKSIINKKNKRGQFSAAVNLMRGRNEFELRHIKTEKDDQYLLLDVFGEDLRIPLSVNSYDWLNLQSYVINPVDKALIHRSVFKDLAPQTIAVGHPGKINYAFNANSGLVNAFWYGEFLDVGENIRGRGQKTCKLLGANIFKGTNGLELLINNKHLGIQFTKYRNFENPRFYYKCGALNVMMESSASGKELMLKYVIKNLKNESIALRIPATVKAESAQGIMHGDILLINKDSRKEFAVSIKE